MFIDPATMDFSVDGAFVTLENSHWHIHLDATKVHKITFVVTADTAHNSTQLSYSMRFFDAQGTALFQAFFSPCTTPRRAYVQSECSSTRRYERMGMTRMLLPRFLRYSLC